MGHSDSAGVELVRRHLPLCCHVCSVWQDLLWYGGFSIVHLRHSICSHIRLAKATRHVLDQSEDYIMDTDVDKADSFEVHGRVLNLLSPGGLP